MLNCIRRLPAVSRRGQAGLSLVELMVGIAVGLFVVAGATVAVSNQLGDNRRLMLETQIQQDLRAAAEVIARDVRRSGYWGSAETGVWHAGAVAVATNSYTELKDAVSGADVVSGVAASGVKFSYSRGAVENNVVDDATDRSGFKLEAGVIKMYVGGNWQALTDGNTLRVTNFQVTLNSRDIDLACFNPCPPGACPKQTVRDITVLIEGAAANDASVRRSARTNVRLRNDLITGACPA